MNEFNGIINLTKDPKAEMLTNENFIKKFSKIKHTQGVVGIVVYTGKHTRVMMNTDFLKQKSNFALALVNKFNIVMILVIFLFGMVFQKKRVVNLLDKYCGLFRQINRTRLHKRV